jgi:PiT family inorganic phosphate transporter
LIRTVGGEITDLDQMRAFSVAMAAAITVIIASQLGLPVSSTHIAIGGIFGVGFLREWLDGSVNNIQDEIEQEKAEIRDEKRVLHALRAELKGLEDKMLRTEQDYQRISNLYREIDQEEALIKKAKKSLKEDKKNLYVRRDAVKKIITAWLITVPSAAVLAAAIFYMIKGIML